MEPTQADVFDTAASRCNMFSSSTYRDLESHINSDKMRAGKDVVFNHLSNARSVSFRDFIKNILKTQTTLQFFRTLNFASLFFFPRLQISKSSFFSGAI